MKLVSISSSKGGISIKVKCDCNRTFSTTNHYYTNCPYCQKRLFIGTLRFKNVDLATIL